MNKSVRNLVLATLVLAASAGSLYAGVTGGAPTPRPASPKPPSELALRATLGR